MFAALVEELIDTDDDALTERLRANELAGRRLAAENAALLAEAERRCLEQVDGHRTIKGYLKANLNFSNDQVRKARQLAKLCNTIANVGDALLDGHIGVAQATELARLRANRRIGDRLHEVAPALLDNAEHLSFDNFRIVTKRWETLTDADGAFDSRIEHRTATVLDINGELILKADGGTAIETAELVAVFDRFVNREFRKDCDQRETKYGKNAPTELLARTGAQRRRDAMQEIFRAADTALANNMSIRPLPTLLNIVVSQYDFEHGLATAGFITTPTDLVEPDIAARRRETSTGTVITNSEIVKAAVHGQIRRIVMNSNGLIVNYSRQRRLFTGPLRAVAKLMGHTCSHPGCDIAAEQCEIDHLQEFVRDHGETSLANSDLDCASHNKHKTVAGLTRQRHGTDRHITRRSNGTAMTPVGQRIPPEPELAARLRQLEKYRAALTKPDKHGNPQFGNVRAAYFLPPDPKPATSYAS